MDNKNQPQDLNLEDFAAKLIEEKGLENVDPEVREQLKTDLLSRIKDRINATILNNMPEDKISEFNQLLDSANEQQLQEYCQQNVPDINNKIAEELMQFRTIYLNL